jgi:hypothetical protein
VAELASPAVTTLADQADWVRPRRRWSRVLGVVALLAIVAGLVTISEQIGTSERIPDGSVSGPSLGTDVSAALGQGPFQQVDAKVEEPARAGADTGTAVTRPVRFILGVDGSWVVSARDRIDQATYDAAKGVVRRVAVVGDGGDQTVAASETTGLASGAPDPEAVPPDELADLQAVGAILRGAGDRRAVATTSGTTPTWTLRRTLPTGADGADEEWRIVIRRSDALPVLVERRAGDRLVRRTSLTGWKLVTQVAADTFAQPLPADVSVTADSHAFLTTDLAAVPMLGRGGAVTPGWLPAGFELSTITVRSEAPADAPSTAGGANPPDVAVLSLGFRKGPLRITVSTRSRGTTGDTWVDPFGAARGGPSGASGRKADTRTLDDGLFNGLRVEVGTDAVGRARLWGVTAAGTGGPDGVVLTVAGDLTPTEAVRLAASLR